MATFTYTATRSLKTGHTADVDYTITSELMQLDNEMPMPEKVTHRTIGGAEVNVLFYIDTKISVTTDYIDSNGNGDPDVADYLEFLHSVAGGEEFSFYNGQAANMLSYSEQFDNAAWGKVASCTVNADTDTAPDGTTTADTIDDSNASGIGYITQSATILDVTLPHTFSVFVEKDAIGRATRFPLITLGFSGGAAGETNLCRFDTATGEIFTGDAQDSDNVVIACDDYSATYWRARITATPAAVDHTTISTTIRPAYGASSGWSASNAAQGAIVAWGAQLSQPGLVDYVRREAAVSAVQSVVMSGHPSRTRNGTKFNYSFEMRVSE